METEIKKTIETIITHIISYEEIENLIINHLHIKEGTTDFYWNEGCEKVCKLKVTKTEYKNEEESKEEKEMSYLYSYTITTN